MKGNEISGNKLLVNAEQWISQLVQVLTIKEYGAGTIKSYGYEMLLLFKYYHHKDVESITQQDIEQYIMYIKSVHKVGRAKCRSVAQACSFFFQKVMKINYIVPSNLYPKKQFLLLNIMSEDEVKHLFKEPLTLKEYCVKGLMYGCGMRISEACNLRLRDIDSPDQRIKIYQGKGAKGL